MRETGDSRTRRGIVAAMVVTCLVVVSPASAGAQSSLSGSVAGVIVDASTGRPLEGATVALLPFPDGLMHSPEHGLAASQVQVTGPDGRYRFVDLTAGRYRLRIERIGFRPATLETAVRQPADSRISVALELAPLALRPLRVEDRAAPPFRRVSGGTREPDMARVQLERQRQEMFLTPDSHILTLADVQDGITLGENDVFRALQRLPGIATRDDYTAELWTRGAPWSLTRVTFDDVPLFNPVHAVGVFSGVSTDALGAVFMHTGIRDASAGQSSAGGVELQSRPGSGTGELRGAADASIATAKLTLEQRPGGGGTAWLLSARRSYLDVFTNGFDWLGVEDVHLPYAFHDVTTRLDAAIGESARLEASGLWEEDRLFGDVEDVVEGTTASWGNSAGRVTLDLTIGSLNTRHHVGVSRYHATIREAGDSAVDERGDPWIEPETDNVLLHLRLAGEISPVAGAASAAPWSAGYEIVTQHADYDGPEPRFHPVRPDTSRRVLRSDRAVRAGFWADRRWNVGRLTVQPGLRVEAGTGATNVGQFRVAPRLQARLTLASATYLSAGAGRSWQDLQALALAGPSAHPAFHAGQFWLQAGDDVPAVRSDLVTISLERWLGGHWLAGASAYFRSSDGLALPDPRPGSLMRRRFFVAGRGRAHGAEAGIRRVAGGWTATAAYAWANASVEVEDYEYASGADRRHRVDATTAVRLPAGFRLGAAWTLMSGAPFTRVWIFTRSPECELFGFGCDQAAAAQVEEANAQRTPAYQSLDAMLAWRRTFGRFDVTTYLQIRNLLDRNNASTYSGTVPRVVRGRGGSVSLEPIDRFEAALPRMPLFGARISF